jgi:hypothetical protein
MVYSLDLLQVLSMRHSSAGPHRRAGQWHDCGIRSELQPIRGAAQTLRGPE